MFLNELNQTSLGDISYPFGKLERNLFIINDNSCTNIRTNLNMPDKVDISADCIAG